MSDPTRGSAPIFVSFDMLAILPPLLRKNGFDIERDTQLLVRAYGRAFGNCKGLLFSYEQWFDTSKLFEAERASNGYATPEECVEGFLSNLTDELGRLKRASQTIRGWNAAAWRWKS